MTITPNKAYLIDVVEKTIKDIEIRDFTQISMYIGGDCEYFTCPVSWANGDTIYADDEGLFHRIEGGAIVIGPQGYPHMIVGNIVVIGGDYTTGASKDVMSTKSEIMARITFVSKEAATNYALGATLSATEYYNN
jgi:hypothetical protein